MLNKTIPLKYQEFYEKSKNQSGRFSFCRYRKELTPKKKFIGHIGKIEKISEFICRAGVDYENISVVKEGHENGDIQSQGLPDSIEKIDTGIYHNVKTDTWMIGISPVENEIAKEKITYLVDRIPTKLEEKVIDIDGHSFNLMDILYKGDFEHKETVWKFLKVDNIELSSYMQ
jgi:hypothetical protein